MGLVFTFHCPNAIDANYYNSQQMIKKNCPPPLGDRNPNDGPNCGKGTLRQSHFHTSKADNIKALLEACYHKRGETYCKNYQKP